MPLKAVPSILCRLYVLQIILTVSGTSICVDATAVTSYVHFHSLGGFILLAVKNEN